MAKPLAFPSGIFLPAKLRIGLGEIEVHLRAAGIDFCGGLEFLHRVRKFPRIQKAPAENIVGFGGMGGEFYSMLGKDEGVSRASCFELDKGALHIRQFALGVDARFCRKLGGSFVKA